MVAGINGLMIAVPGAGWSLCQARRVERFHSDTGQSDDVFCKHSFNVTFIKSILRISVNVQIVLYSKQRL